jgi:xylan 1,4-beta-xylosidase
MESVVQRHRCDSAADAPRRGLPRRDAGRRTRNPWGPFEPAPTNPVLTHRHRVGHPIQSVGHADLVDDENGNWWALFLGTRHEANNGFVVHHNLGRETFLAPVEWTSDGWPTIGTDGTVELDMTLNRPLPSATSNHLSTDLEK